MERIVTPRQFARGYVVRINGVPHYRRYHAVGREGQNYVVREPEVEMDEPRVGKIELFPDQHTPAPLDRCIDSLQAASVTANDLLAAMKQTPVMGSFTPIDQIAVHRAEELKRERQYKLLQAAAVMCTGGYSQSDAVDRAEWLLAEIERRIP